MIMDDYDTERLLDLIEENDRFRKALETIAQQDVGVVADIALEFGDDELGYHRECSNHFFCRNHSRWLTAKRALNPND